MVITPPGACAPGREAFSMSTTASGSADDLDLRRRRALYRAEHRGTKEMDWLLGRYAVAKLPTMDAPALTHFEQLIALSDVDLHAWIIKPDAIIDTAFERTIYDIRAFHDITTRVN
jgi:antitoxin CptB